MKHAVERALQERGIDRDDWPQPACGEPPRKSDAMLFRDSDVVKSFAEPFRKFGKPRSARHGGGQSNDLRVFLRQGNQRIAERGGE